MFFVIHLLKKTFINKGIFQGIFSGMGAILNFLDIRSHVTTSCSMNVMQNVTKCYILMCKISKHRIVTQNIHMTKMTQNITKYYVLVCKISKHKNITKTI